jgi:MFS transporter, CP family, cyanate transporter
VAERAAIREPASLPLGRRDWLHLALLWLGGFDLRVTLLAVPPVIPLIHRDFALDEKSVSILTGLPVLLLALAAVPGALLIARLGPRRALILGLLAVAFASAARGLGPRLPVLFAATLVMGIGVAVSQPVFPTLTRDWFPIRVGIATAVYSNGLLVGETVPASLTGPLVAPALGGSWPLTFAFWSLPVLLGALLVLRFTDHLPVESGAPRRWWPDFRDVKIWQVGLVMGCVSACYFGTNAFLPDFLHATGRPQFKDAALAALNTGQLPASLLVMAAPARFMRRRWPFLVTGCLICAGALMLVLTPGGWVVVWAAVIGFAAAFALVPTLALPALLARPEDVHRFSAGIFLIIYGFSFIGPLAGGALWDATGLPGTAFLTLAALGALVAGLAPSLQLRPAAA